MLAIPRPTTRGECLQEARPCPWVACSHHTLLEITQSNGRAPTMRLNSSAPSRGRRAGLSYRSDAAEVRMFVAEAVETLSRMEHTCALDYVDAKGHGELQLARDVGEALGVTKQQVLRDIGQAQASARAALESADIDGTSIHRVEGEHTHRSRRGGAE